MLKEIEAGNFLESAQFSGNYYGTSYKAIEDVLASSRSVILDIDMQGVKQLQAQLAEGRSRLAQRPLFVFLAPPSVTELERRLRGRGTESEDSLQKRLAASRAEMEWGTQPGAVDFVIVNDEVDAAYERLRLALVAMV
ncbi:hypothetical protein HK405_011142 [Cladochytrium tenue]|nr:hypothetical protein HK405_011142 [Cladochytrium tenue]